MVQSGWDETRPQLDIVWIPLLRLVHFACSQTVENVSIHSFSSEKPVSTVCQQLRPLSLDMTIYQLLVFFGMYVVGGAVEEPGQIDEDEELFVNRLES
jgi:hypothetical protein